MTQHQAAELHTEQALIQDLEDLDLIWNPQPNPYHSDPVSWVHHEANVETWSKQDEIYNAVNTYRYTAVKSCHGPGKSFTAANVIAWWLATKRDPFVVTSAPTSHQVRTILWREIRRAKKSADLGGKISQGQVPEWRMNEELVAFGRKPADYLDPVAASAAFQGIHASHLLVVLDEGSGIPDWLAQACETLITNEDSRLLIIGNPDNPLSYFAKAFKPASGFHNITISAFDCPAFTGERVSDDLSKRLTSRLWVEERAKRWGTTSPLYKSKVEAEFPDITDDTVFTPMMMSMAIANDRSRQAVDEQGRYGFDVARLGADETVIYHNRNGYVRSVGRWSKTDTMETVGRYRRLLAGVDPEHTPPAVVDVNGLGAGVFDRLKELHYPVIPFNGGERAHNPMKYKNRRSESYWEAREMFEEGLIDLEELDEDLQAELLEMHFKPNSTGQIQIESKEDITQRLGRSPDRADAFVMSLQKTAILRVQPTNSPQNRQNLSQTEQKDQQIRVNHPDSDLFDPTEPDDLVGDLMDMDF
jgi:hypothetical protein